MSAGARFLWFIPLIAASLLAACADDPVHSAAVAALGPERPSVPVGPYHRAGQPCTVCHGLEGPAKTAFSLAGTVFSAPYTSATAVTTGVGGATVGFVDDEGVSGSATTNCVGNFFVTFEEYNPAFPILVAVSKPGAGTIAMSSHIGRDTACATCHGDSPGASAVGHVYLSTTPSPSDSSCPVSPSVGESE